MASAVALIPAQNAARTSMWKSSVNSASGVSYPQKVDADIPLLLLGDDPKPAAVDEEHGISRIAMFAVWDI